MVSHILILLMTALPLMGSPGPATLSLAAVGAAFGACNGLRYLAGIIMGTACVLLLAASGITGAFFAIPAARIVVFALGAAYVVYLAYRIATAPPVSINNADEKPSMAGGFLLAIANPKAYAAIGAAYASHVIVVDDRLADAVVKVVVLGCVIVSVNFVWLYFGSILSRFLSDPLPARFTNFIFAALLIASVTIAAMNIAVM